MADDEGSDVVMESDSVIMQLVNKLLTMLPPAGYLIFISSPISVKNVEIRFRVDGDCAIYQALPFSYRQALVSRIKIMSNLDITEKKKSRKTVKSNSDAPATMNWNFVWPPSPRRVALKTSSCGFWLKVIPCCLWTAWVS